MLIFDQQGIFHHIQACSIKKNLLNFLFWVFFRSSDKNITHCGRTRFLLSAHGRGGCWPHSGRRRRHQAQSCGSREPQPLPHSSSHTWHSSSPPSCHGTCMGRLNRVSQSTEVDCILEDLKCWGAWDTTCGRKAKEIKPSTAWRVEAWKEEALNNLPWKNEKGPLSIRPTLELFQRQCRGNFWKIGLNFPGIFPSTWIQSSTKLNWTERRLKGDDIAVNGWNGDDSLSHLQSG